MGSANRTIELVEQLIESKENLTDMLVRKGEEASADEPFDDLVQKAGEYMPKSFIFVDGNGNEFPGVTVEKETVFTATANDIREGKVAASALGVVTGDKFIPTYVTLDGCSLISNGQTITLKNLLRPNSYDFKILQAIICPYAGSIANSVAAEKVGIGEKVYEVKSTVAISTITRDHTNKAIDFGITNNSGSLCVIRYFTYKEEI